MGLLEASTSLIAFLSHFGIEVHPAPREFLCLAVSGIHSFMTIAGMQPPDEASRAPASPVSWGGKMRCCETEAQVASQAESGARLSLGVGPWSLLNSLEGPTPLGHLCLVGET